MTESPCSDGKPHPATGLDCFGGSIQGVPMEDNMRAAL